MSIRSLYRRRRAFSFWCLITITLIALYQKLNLNFNILHSYPQPLPQDEKELLKISFKTEKPEKPRLFPVVARYFQTPDAVDDLMDDDDEEENKDVQNWKLKTLHYYLNNTGESSIFPASHIGRYVMLSSKICSNVDIVDILIIVHTAPINIEKRQRIRQSFAKRSFFLPFEVRVAFLMGKPKDEMLKHVLFAENSNYNDTVMGDFFDDYHNLTLKGVMGFRWISQFCSNAQFILKIDDDVIVDMYKVLTTYIPHMKGKQKSLFCNVWRKNMRIERSGKWMVPPNVFPNTTVFPFYYCSGFTLLMSRDLIHPLYVAAKETPLFWIDDLYLFGMLPFAVGGVTYYDYQIGRNISISQEETYDCWNKLGLQCSLLSTLVRKENYWQFWKKIRELNDRSSWRALTFFEA